MGPPHLCGGMTGKRSRQRPRSRRFNGAAASLRRNAKPRPSHCARTHWLQWGRRISAAECRRTRAGFVNARLASMGPPHLCGGMQLCREGLIPQYSLQWGRRISAAECCPAGFDFQSHHRFNGAAASLRRNGSYPRLPPRGRPGFNGAAASLRRNGESGLGIPPPAATLQWGRRISAAEWAKPASEPVMRVWLQWGRRISAAECTTCRSPSGSPCCFNGAAASLRRNGDGGGYYVTVIRGFNGAAASLRRNGFAPERRR